MKLPYKKKREREVGNLLDEKISTGLGLVLGIGTKVGRQ